ncbi:MAG: ABC transporter permease [Clostridiales bacterium]
MNLNSITKKLVKKNIKEYLLIIFSIAFTVGIVTTLGIIIFSSSVSNVFYPGGTSQEISYLMYATTVLACVVFMLFVQSLFMRYKSKEIGIFMSLGVRKKYISKLLKKELFYIMTIGSITGIIFAIPISTILWNILALLFENKETKFSIGFKGIIVGFIFSIAAYYIMNIITKRYVYKVNLIQILKTTSTIEKVNFGTPFLGAVGFILIPLGIIGIFIGSGTSNPILNDLDMIGLVFCIIGIYLFSTQVATIGRIVNAIRNESYFKNIIFFNLLKLKGKQFALSLFIGTILTAAGLYSLLFMVAPTIEQGENLKNAKYDFGYIQVSEKNALNEDDIVDLANKESLKVLDFKDLEGFFLTPYEKLSDLSNEWFWAEDKPFISESSFKKFFNRDLDVTPGKYVLATGYSMITSSNNELIRPRFKIKFFNTNKKEFNLKAEKTIELKNNILPSDFLGIIRVLDDSDYEKIKTDIKNDYSFKYKTFNVDKLNESLNFSNKFFDKYLEVNNYKFVQSFHYRGLQQISGEKIVYEDIKKLNPDIKREWSLMPYSRIDQQINGRSDAAVYFLVFGIISLACILASSLIIGIKILNSMWEEKVLFKNISFLGCKKDYIKSIVIKQVMLLYFFPNLLASLIILSIYTSGVKNHMVYFNKILVGSYLIVLFVMTISIIVSLIISRKISKECIHFTKI